MKQQKFNRNIIWSELFFRQLFHNGVKQAVLCPGSRNTPLVFGITKSKIKTYNLVDERSAAYFALGIAKKTKQPVAIITTSGTAVTELYPAIVEAFFTRTPLVICTADRPPELQNCGSSQTINQKNIFENHIRYFLDAGTPDLKEKNLQKLCNLTKKAIEIACIRNRGPVHINLPFRKPFEPDSFTDELNEGNYIPISNGNYLKSFGNVNNTFSITKKNVEDLSGSKSGLILYTGKNPSKELDNLIHKLSVKLKYPIIEDSTSGIRFTKSKNSSSTSNFTSMARCENVPDPEIMLQFGDAPISNSLLNFFQHSKAKKYLINEYGDLLDPSKTYNKIIKAKPEDFCQRIIKEIKTSPVRKAYYDKVIDIDKRIEETKSNFVSSADFSFEGKVISELVRLLPDKTNIMISNSTPVRDFDVFTLSSEQNHKVFTNRGTAGIDGIISTALGISSMDKTPTVLITGDLAFYYDLNGLLASVKYNIPLVVVLLNNNGGGIFEMLPVSKHKIIFEINFKTPTNLDFAPFVKGYDGDYYLIDNLQDLKDKLDSSIKKNKLSVLEIKTDSKESARLRSDFKDLVVKQVSDIVNDN